MSDAYANRTDLQSPAAKVAKTAATGQTYGKATEQMRAQQAVPMGRSPVEAQQQRPVPGTLGTLTRPSERPAEPITAGAPFGAGPSTVSPSSMVAPTPGSRQDLAERVRAIYANYPNPNLLSLLNALETE